MVAPFLEQAGPVCDHSQGKPELPALLGYIKRTDNGLRWASLSRVNLVGVQNTGCV